MASLNLGWDRNGASQWVLAAGPADPGGTGSCGHEALAVPAPVCALELLPCLRSHTDRALGAVIPQPGCSGAPELAKPFPAVQHPLQRLRHRYRLTLSSHFCA